MVKENTLKTKVAKIIACTDKKKDGTEMKDKKGNKKWRVVINVPEHNARPMTAFLYENPELEEGKTIDLIWWEEENEYNGQMQKQLYWRFPNKIEHLENTVAKLGLDVASLMSAVFPNGRVPGTNLPYPDSKPTAFDNVNPAPVLEEEELESLEETYNAM